MSNLPFLLLILLFIAVAPTADLLPTSFAPVDGLLWGLMAYLLTLVLIAIQSFYYKASWPSRRAQAQKLANVELVFWMFLFCFMFGSVRMVEPFATLGTLFPLSLYFFGLAFFYSLTPPAGSTTRSELYFLLPFALPLLCLNFISDVAKLYDFGLDAENLWSPYALGLTFISVLAFFGMLMIFLPWAIQVLWQCRPLEGPLRQRLEALCAKANFHYRDLKTWGVMDHALTAAILGIHSRFRYILFTKRLIAEMSPECVEAILCHEIGHNKHKHLIFYPFLIAGMVLIITFLTLFFDETIPHSLDKYSITLSPFEWQLLTSFWLLFCYIAIPLVYLRYLFGFFSRLFERQADLHIFSLGIEPSAMIEALEHIGIVTGTLRQPNWHHFSLQERIDFLKAADVNRNLIAMHHRFVQTMLYIYFGCFFTLLWFLFNSTL